MSESPLLPHFPYDPSNRRLLQQLFKTSIIVSILIFGFFLSLSAPAIDAEEVDKLHVGNREVEEVDIHFGPGGGIDPSLSIPLPSEGPIISSSIKISTIDGMAGPDKVSLDIGMDGREDWSFGGGKYGGFGHQYNFRTGENVHRVHLDDDTQSTGFLLPGGAVINNASISISSPPEAYPSGLELISSDDDEVPLDSFDAGDLDGDGRNEMVFYSISDSSIIMIDDIDSGTPVSSVIKENIDWVSHLRVLEDNPSQRGGVIAQFSVDSEQNESVSFFEPAQNDDFKETLLSSGQSKESIAFHIIRSDNYGAQRIMVLDNDRAGIYEYHFDISGSVSKQIVLDNTIELTGIGASDLNGDGMVDIVLFPADMNEKITVQMSISDENEEGVKIFELGPSSKLFAQGASIDIDGNGEQEFFFPLGNNSDIAVISMQGSKPHFSWVGLNSTGSVPRSLDRECYGDSGYYSGGEGFLYLVSTEGISQVLPVSTVEGSYLVSQVSGIGGPALITGEQSSVEASIFTFTSDLGISRGDISWSSLAGLDLHMGSSVSSMDLSDHDLYAISLLDHLGQNIQGKKEMDHFGNDMINIVMDLYGPTGFISLKGLDISYDIEFDTVDTPGFITSMQRTSADFDGTFIPFMIKADSQGSVSVGPAITVYDAPPEFLTTLPRRIAISEGSMGETILDLKDHVEDDIADFGDLNLEIIPITEIPSGLLFIDRNGGVISHAYEYPDLYGDFEFMIKISDINTYSLSKSIELVIEPVQDPPRVSGPMGDIFLKEGRTERIQLTGEDGLFMDPDGDDLDFTFRIISTDPPKLRETLNIMRYSDHLDIEPSIHGIGGTARLEIMADDQLTKDDDLPVAVMTLRVADVNSPPWIGDNPGSVVLSEDQDTPTKISLENWFIDPDTHLSEYELLSYSSDPRLITYFELSGSKPELFIIPTGELVGEETILVELNGYNTTLTDRLLVNIRPVNDLPVTTIDSVEYNKGMGWIIRGHVDDPDDSGGRIEYRVGNGEWRDAWGFNVWSILVEESIVPASGIYVSVRADDGSGPSAVTYTKLLWPYSPPDLSFPDDPGDDNTPYDPGTEPTGGNKFAPDDPDDNELPWLFIGGIGSLAAAFIIFLLWSEVGFVTMVTSAISLYSKLSKKDILNHEIRGLIRGYIIANPGDHYSSIKRNLDLNNGTLAYHLRVLEQNGFIKSMYDGIYKRYYPANINISKLKKNVSKQEEIFNIILDNPGITMEQIGRMIGVSRQVVNYHVKNLIRGGVVTYSRDRKSAKFYPAETSVAMGET